MLLAVTAFQLISAVFFSIFALLLMSVILLQRGRGVGLAGAFGGGGAAATFGAKTGDILTWTTIIMFGMYVVFAIGLNYIYRPGEVRIAPAAVAPAQAAPETGAGTESTTPSPLPSADVPPAPASSDVPAGSAAPAAGESAPAAPPASGPASG